MAATPDDFSAIPILLELVRDDVAARACPAVESSVPVALPESPQITAREPPAQIADADASVRQPGAMFAKTIVHGGVRSLPGREAQQSLFDALDLPPAIPPPAARRKRLPPTLQRMAEDLLRTRAPAIINELADEHARRLSTELRERLRKELARLLAELAEQHDDADASSTIRTDARHDNGGAPSPRAESPE